jgi:hypothetical protein
MRQNEIILGDCREVAVLFARADSVYKELPWTDVWDIHRDATRWPGGSPVVAHPPCRAWASLRHCAKPRAGEKDLAFLAIGHVRRYGGVLEHPQLSTLWKGASLPEVGRRDEYGGWTLIVDQQWFGHRARKRTKLYIVGCSPQQLPTMPMVLGEATHTVGLWSGRDKQKARPSIRKSEFEATPREFAIWLCEVARRAGDAMERMKAA